MGAVRTGGVLPIVYPVTTLPVAFVSESALPILRARDLAWRVHSVFRQALNLRARDHLVAVAPQAAGGLPNGIAISGHPDFRALGLTEGMALAGAWPMFEIPEAAIRLDLSRAWAWSPRLATGTIDAADGRTRRRVDAAADIVAARATRVGFGQCVALLRPVAVGAGSEQAPGWAGTVAGPAQDGAISAASAGMRSIEAMRHAISGLDGDSAFEAADALIGLGDGLTPSGDDFLVGLTAALRAAGHEFAGPIARHAAERAQGATTDVARVALEHASRGEYAERIHDVLRSLASDEGETLHVQIDRALSWGASSGADSLLGMLVGLEAAAA
jgi:hypothetical protein